VRTGGLVEGSEQPCSIVGRKTHDLTCPGTMSCKPAPVKALTVAGDSSSPNAALACEAPVYPRSV